MAGGSLKPEYFNDKINVAILLAPPVSMYYMEDTKVSLLSASPMR